MSATLPCVQDVPNSINLNVLPQTNCFKQQNIFVHILMNENETSLDYSFHWLHYATPAPHICQGLGTAIWNRSE